MIILRLFLIFCKIGIFTFGGGYSMVALIQNEVVEKYHWLTAEEFTDLLAVSQMTPGPVGINTATYTGYTVVLNNGGEPWMGVVGSLVASFAVILLPFIAMLLLCRFLAKHRDNPIIDIIFRVLRLAVVGLIAAAAISLASVENFGSWDISHKQVIISVALFVAVFVASFKFKKSPIMLLLASGAVGFLAYYVFLFFFYVMTKGKYKKSINLHFSIMLCIGVISLVFCILSQFNASFSKPAESHTTQILLAMLTVLIAALQYFYTRNILKNRLARLLNLDTSEQKVSKYHSLMLQSFYMSALSLVAIALLSCFVQNSILICLEGLVFLFSVILLKPSAYRMKMDLQLSEKEIAGIYGENWDK